MPTSGSLIKGVEISPPIPPIEVMVKVLARKTASRVELKSFNPAYEDRVLEPKDILWMARIVWASQ